MRNDFQFNDNVLDEQRAAITSLYFAKEKQHCYKQK